MTDLEIKQMQKVDAEISKLIAETSKLNKETFWYPMVITAGLFAGIGAFVKFFL